MNILVAGGAGFIGSHLVDRLMERGDKVVVADNLCLGKREHFAQHLDNPRFVFYEFDVTEAVALRELFERHEITRVYHLAANSDIQKGGENPTIDIHDTLETTLTLLQAMRDYGIKELLFASSSAIYGEQPGLLTEDGGGLQPVSYYGAAKLASEAFISAFAAMCDMRANIIRFPNVVGPRLTHGAVYDFVNKLKANPRELEILGDGQQEKPYIYVQDLVEALLFPSFADIGVNVFNVGVESATTARRIADIVCEEMGLTDVKYHFTGGPVGWKGDVARFQYDLAKIHAAGWRAKHSSDEAVRLAAKAALVDL
ncbi:MAG: SDR family NAD(P)-dependent oxidoreductase [Lachnospiraceae bacterium]|jgi:UDP-glucose 4-epimerase|nr:SDR family NAD(P)-dependent oxidoreductase [Lachnospiraceae bacterium]